jgi:DNA polymerase-3 subunit beta
MNSMETKTLGAALERLAFVVPKKGNLPVLQNLRWRLVEDKIELVATDLDNVVQVFVPLTVHNGGTGMDFLVPADLLCQALKDEPSPAVEVSVQDNKFEVRAGNRVIVLPCEAPDQFPRVPNFGEAAGAKLLASALKDALGKTLFCMSTAESRYTLDALKLEIHGSLFRLVATDGHRLSWVEGAARNGASAGVETLVLRSTARLLARLLSRTEAGWVDFTTCQPDSSEDFNVFQFPDGMRLIGRRAQGQFPNYEAVLPRAPIEATILFDREELVKGLEKLWPVASKQHNHPVAFEFPDGRTVIKTEADQSQARAELWHTHVSGKARQISFNHTYLTQYLRSVEMEKISCRLYPQALCEAVLFDSFRYRHLLMPLRS